MPPLIALCHFRDAADAGWRVTCCHVAAITITRLRATLFIIALLLPIHFHMIRHITRHTPLRRFSMLFDAEALYAASLLPCLFFADDAAVYDTRCLILPLERH